MRNMEVRQHQGSSHAALANWLLTGVLCCTGLSSAYAQVVIPNAGIINTIAGNGTYGYSGDGGTATSAKLGNPLGMAVDSAGNIYFLDAGNLRVRKVTASTGNITTVAGNGTQGYSGDGGAATSAEINAVAVAVDNAGNLYIADSGNNRIRKVTASSGVITTVAGNGTSGYSGDGGAATSAELYNPTGVAVDSAGNIYIADQYNYRVRKVTASSGNISTVAGNGTAGYSGDGGAATSAELYNPAAVAVDGAGNIYIVDLFNFRVRKVTASSGIIGTVAGNGTRGFSGDGGAATSAEVQDVESVAVDGLGNIYIADTFNSVVRKVTASTGIISTMAGNGTSGYSGDGGTATSAELNTFWGVAVDAAGNVYIGDSSNSRVRVVGTGASAKLSDFEDITTGWALCTGVSCAGGTHDPTSTSQTFGNVTPSLDGGSMLLSESGPAGANNGWYYEHAVDDAATSFTLDLEFNIQSNTGIQALEFDQYQYLHAGSGGVTSNTQLFFGTECVNGGNWQVWDASGLGWIDTGVACSYLVSSTAFNHLTIRVHRVTGDTSCTNGYPCMHYDAIILNGRVVVSNVTTNSGALPSGWAEVVGFFIQLDTSNACGSACTISESIDKGTFWH